MKNELSLKTCETELIGLGITMAARAVSRFFNKSLKGLGVTMTQAYAMYAISEYRGYNTGYIAKKLYIDHCVLRKCIESIKKYVEIHKDSSDKRATYPALTQEGAIFLRKIMPKLIEFEQGIGHITQNKDFFINFIHTFSTKMVRSKIGFKMEMFDGN